ncbi:hypothetical protein PF007_g27881 [Phytophthora fragariae]|uniref:Secreted protein n=1 Tax=Phytophthora fragariae TaxID=53985 RepID=A0A6A3Q3A9_9STRA|nr:hypothetical protein PF003_g35841 [Phytophthora fragariae]KAE9066786.1 hypothetical protein PF006_g30142 [Phytophthora fragariae]KAE9067926.1 hypothetical protein PF007_g27881 [Phytophthora fragariae]KAE9280836.1 hypothetical protein PF008_g28042 [Phytophthora fragariae]KAE9286264.1 hypothetical protein PF001_g21526 [Phytophthora fragariae]
MPLLTLVYRILCLSGCWRSCLLVRQAVARVCRVASGSATYSRVGRTSCAGGWPGTRTCNPRPPGPHS